MLQLKLSITSVFMDLPQVRQLKVNPLLQVKWFNNCLWNHWTWGLNALSLQHSLDLEEVMDKLSWQTTQSLILCPLDKSLNPTFLMNNCSRISRRNFLAKLMRNLTLACSINTRELFKSYRTHLFGKIFSIQKIQKKRTHRLVNWMRAQKTRKIMKKSLLKTNRKY